MHAFMRPLAVAGVALAAMPLAAQLPSASPAALAMGDNYTAMARGFAAVSWNPANLGLASNPTFSLTIFGIRAASDLGPITLGDIAQYGGETLPDDAKAEWMTRVEAGRGELGDLGAGITYFGLSAGRFAVQLSSAASGAINLAPGAVELALYGNAGRTGSASDFELANSRLTTAATSTAAIAFAHPVDFAVGRLSLGITGKYVIGHAFVHGEDRGSSLAGDPVAFDLRFPIVVSDTGDAGAANRGRGVGIDLGATWNSGPMTWSVVAHDVVNSFRWDADRFFYYPIQAFFDADTSYTVSTARPIAEAPDDVRAWVEDQRVRPSIAIGASFRPTGRLTVAADLRRQLGSDLTVGARTHAGVGAEWRVLPFVPLRAGFSLYDEGFALAAGTGIELGPVNLTISAQDRHSRHGRAPGFAAGVSMGDIRR